jgi:hypothetical protein
MKLIIFATLIVALSFTTSHKPPNFLQDYTAYDNALFDYALAKLNGGDTVTTRLLMLSKAADLSQYDVPEELAKAGPIQQGCRWACAGQFYFYCLNFAPNDYEAKLCMNEYIECMRTCGYLPV